ncbi:MAG: leucine-rich repeat domain-containing protein [Lentimicrobiaceae bacterium]|nr:leucine-rich repeat domain-containing protein [Lentimicrobiaceae bacterium]
MKNTILFIAFIGLVLSTNAQDTIASGVCGDNGDNITWVLTNDSVLTISGSGAMADQSYDYEFEYFIYIDQIKTVVIDSGITTIGYGSFELCTNLIFVNIPNSVTNIKENAFAYCIKLTSVIIPNSVDTIGKCAFVFCASLTSMVIPNLVTTIEYGTFGSCHNLASVNIPKSVITIGEAAFAYCRSLPSITIPESVATIGIEAFSDCSNLISVIIPDSVTTIGNGAFWDCRSLKFLSIGRKVTRIEDNAFRGCFSLDTIVCKAVVPPVIYPNTFLNVPNFIPVYIPCHTLLTYYQKSAWGDYFINLIEDCTDINETVQTKKISVFPNPAQSQFTVKNTENADIQLFNTLGQEVFHTYSQEESTVVEVGSLPQGVYMLKVLREDGSFSVRKVVKQ